jgi:hypothetical protein
LREVWAYRRRSSGENFKITVGRKERSGRVTGRAIRRDRERIQEKGGKAMKIRNV